MLEDTINIILNNSYFSALLLVSIVIIIIVIINYFNNIANLDIYCNSNPNSNPNSNSNPDSNTPPTNTTGENYLQNGMIFDAVVSYIMYGFNFLLYNLGKLFPSCPSKSLWTLILFAIIILLAGAIYLFIIDYKINPSAYKTRLDKDGLVNFLTSQARNDFLIYIFKIIVIIISIFLFFVFALYVVSGLTDTNNLKHVSRIVHFLGSLILIIMTLAIIHEFINYLFNSAKDPNSNITLGGFIKDIIFYIPCLLIEFIKYIEYQFKITTKPIWILLFLELIIITLYFIIPEIYKKVIEKDGYKILTGPVYTNNFWNLGTYQNLNSNLITQLINREGIDIPFKNESVSKISPQEIYNYNFFICFSLWINPQLNSTNSKYNQFTSLFSYGQRPQFYIMQNQIYLKLFVENLDDSLILLIKTTNLPCNCKTIYETNDIPYQSWMNFIITFTSGK